MHNPIVLRLSELAVSSCRNPQFGEFRRIANAYWHVLKTKKKCESSLLLEQDTDIILSQCDFLRQGALWDRYREAGRDSSKPFQVLTPFFFYLRRSHPGPTRDLDGDLEALCNEQYLSIL